MAWKCWALLGEAEISKGEKSAGAEVDFGGGEDVGKLREGVTEIVDDLRRPTVTVEVESDVTQMIQKMIPKKKETDALGVVEVRQQVSGRSSAEVER